MVAPPPVKVEEKPKQMGDEEAAVTKGKAFTTTAAVACAVHPLASVPTTVYVVFEVGETIIGEPLRLPGFHK